VGWEIAMHLNPDVAGMSCPVAWPSHEFLKDKLGVGDATIKRAVAELEKNQIYRVERRRNGEGRKNYYRAPGVEEGIKVGIKVGIKNDGGRDQIDPYPGIKSDPITSLVYLQEELHQHQHQHHHQHHHPASAIAAELTTQLIKLGNDRLLREPASVREELAKVQSWLAKGWNPTAMLRSAELQMARRRKSGHFEPICTLGYFETEFRKVFGTEMGGDAA
jgi:hypothetical protein